MIKVDINKEEAADGWQHPYFEYCANKLLDTKKSKFNTREQYCRYVAGFVDYLLESAKL